MAINYMHKDDLPQFVADNIAEINRGIKKFKINPNNNPNGAIYDDVHIKEYLKNKLANELDSIKNALINEFESANFVKARIEDIANKYTLYKKDLENIFEAMVFSELKNEFSDKMVKAVVDAIFTNTGLSDMRKKFLRKSINNITSKSLLLLLQNGFLINLNNIDNGVMTSNAGDSAQFLFISRAILAGFNCSNVDVRSSRYDAVIDFKNKIFRVQVKGVSGNVIHFKDMPRGGRGTDWHNERNMGKRITSDDCDIYVAVDKQVGLCYIIPMKNFDPNEDGSNDTVNISELGEYLENWNVISELYNDMYTVSE